MKKKYFIPAIFIFLSSYSFSQTAATTTTDISSETRDTIASYSADILIDRSTHVFQKTPLPSGQKAAPAIIYIKNDKPVDQVTYMLELQNASGKK